MGAFLTGLLLVGYLFSLWKYWKEFFFIENILVIEVDDWGRQGIPEGEITLEELGALFQTLLRYRDKHGRHPVITANFVMTNPNYKKIAENDFTTYYYLPINEGLDLDLLNQYKEGIKLGIFWPQYHGRDHINSDLWLKDLKRRFKTSAEGFEEKAILPLGKDEKRYIGEYGDASFFPQKPLPEEKQMDKIEKGLEIFASTFGYRPKSTIAPYNLFDEITEKCWSEKGIQYIQGGNRQRLGFKKGKYVKAKEKRHILLGKRNRFGGLYLKRDIGFPPSKDLDRILKKIALLFKTGRLVTLYNHSYDYKNQTGQLERLDSLLSWLQNRYPEMVYLTSDQLGSVIEKGYFEVSQRKIYVERAGLRPKLKRIFFSYLMNL